MTTRKRTILAAAVTLGLATVVAGAWLAVENWPARARPSVAGGPTITVTLLGDMGLGLAEEAAPWIEAHGWHEAYAHVREAYRASDFVIANLEAPLVPDGMIAVEKVRRPKQPPPVAQVFARERFYALGLANNHQMDFGPDGLAHTMQALHTAGVATFGAGRNLAEATRPLVIEKSGIRVAIIGGCSAIPKRVRVLAEEDQAGVAPMTGKKLRKAVKRLRRDVDAIVVFPHWGKNWVQKLTKDQTKLAKAAAKAGADVVVGHHAHVAQRAAIIRQTPVLYSIGNFVYHGVRREKQYQTVKHDYALVTHLVIGKDGVREVILEPFFNQNLLVDFTPRPATQAEAEQLFADILAPINGWWTWRGTAAVIDAARVRSGGGGST